jgi:hypothetical protein
MNTVQNNNVIKIDYVGKHVKQIIKNEALSFVKNTNKGSRYVLRLAKEIQINLNKGKLTEEYINEKCDGNDDRILINYILFMAKHRNFISKDGTRFSYFTTNTTTLSEFLKEIGGNTTISTSMNLVFSKLINILSLKAFHSEELKFKDLEINFNKMFMRINQDNYSIKIVDKTIILTNNKKQEYVLWLNNYVLHLIPLDRNLDDIVVNIANTEHLVTLKDIENRLTPEIKSLVLNIFDDSSINNKSDNFYLFSCNGSIAREILILIKVEKIKLNQNGLNELINLLNLEKLEANFNEKNYNFQEKLLIIDKILNNAIFHKSETKIIYSGDSVLNRAINFIPYSKSLRILLRSYGVYNQIVLQDDNAEQIEEIELNELGSTEKNIKNCYYDRFNSTIYINVPFRSRGIYNKMKNHEKDRNKKIIVNYDYDIKLQIMCSKGREFNLYEYDLIDNFVEDINAAIMRYESINFIVYEAQVKYAAKFIKDKFKLKKVIVRY